MTGLLIFFRMAVIEAVVVAAIERQGLTPISLQVQRADISGLTLNSVRLKEADLGAKSVEVTFSPSSLREGRVYSITINELALVGSWSEDGISFGLLNDFIEEQLAQDAGTTATELPFNQLQMVETAVTITHPVGPINLAADININTSDQDFAVRANSTLNGPGLKAEIAFDGTVSDGAWLRALGAGKLSLKAENFVAPGLSAPIAADLELNAIAQDGDFSFRSAKELTISAPWPFSMGGLEDGKKTFELSLQTHEPGSPFLRLAAEDDLYRATVDIDALWDTPIGGGSATVAGKTSLSSIGIIEDFSFERLKLQIHGTPTPAGVLWANISGDQLRGESGTAEGRISLSGRLVDGGLGDISFEQIDMDAATKVGFEGTTLTFSLSELAGRISSGRYANQVQLDEPLQFSLVDQAPKAQFLTLELDPNKTTVGTFETAVQVKAPKTGVLDLDSELFINTSIPRLSLSGSWTRSNDQLELKADVQDADIQSDSVALTKISASIVGTADRYSGVLSSSIKILDARPNSIAAVVKSDLKYEDNSYIIKGVTETPLGKKLGEHTLTYQPDMQTGHLSAQIGPVVLGGAGLSPSDLRPFALPFTPTAGEFAANIDMPIGANSTGAQNGSIYVKDLELEAPSYAVRLMNAAVDLTSVWPVKTDGSQTVAIGLLQAGVPVTNVLATFDIQSSEALDITEIDMTFAEGRLQGGPFSINLAGQSTAASLQVSGVSLPALASLSTLEGLDASGDLSGQIPLRLTPNGILIDHGTLTTSGPGYVRYKPGQTAGALDGTQASQGGMGLALQALENFQYDSIVVTVSGSVLEELEASLAIKGRNPNLYNGYPIDFNLNLSGELANVIQGSLAGYRVPETIKRQLLTFPQSP